MRKWATVIHDGTFCNELYGEQEVQEYIEITSVGAGWILEPCGEVLQYAELLDMMHRDTRQKSYLALYVQSVNGKYYHNSTRFMSAERLINFVDNHIPEDEQGYVVIVPQISVSALARKPMYRVSY